jgi:acetolactate synthase-1/2/3 large subunit
VDNGVDEIFGVPGDTGVAFYDALYRAPNLRHILARDERHAAFMADCYGRVTGRPGVVEVSSGGGCTYVVGGLGEAFAASVPVVVIASDIQASSRGTGALTEINQIALFSAVTKAQFLVESADQMAQSVAAAFDTACAGRPGPVVLIIPENVLDEPGPALPSLVRRVHQCPAHRPVPSADLIVTATEMVASAARPAVVAGSGVHFSRAWDELRFLVETLGVPVATSIHGKGVIAENHPLYLGVVGGNGGSEVANDYLAGADTVLFVGTRANATDTNGWTAPPRKGTRIVQVDIDPRRAGRNYPGSIGIVGDAALTLSEIVAGSKPNPERAEQWADWIRQRRSRLAGPRRNEAGSIPAGAHHGLSAAEVIATLRRVVGDRPHVVVADPGTPTPHLAEQWTGTVSGRTIIAPRGHGPMGYAIPGAVGARIARPDDAVIAITADGSFAMACGELETIARLDLPIVFVQLTNRSLGWIKMLQHLYADGRYFGVDVGPFDAVQVARAAGLRGLRATSLDELAAAAAAAIEGRYPVYIDVPVQHLIVDVPPVASWHSALDGDVTRPVY